jgi:K+-transporting ATPase ATPase C chain
MLTELLTALRLIGLTILICAIAYPLGVLAFAAVAAPDARMGSLLTDSEGRVVGSRLVAQSFAQTEYFWPRPSAVDYNEPRRLSPAWR